MSTKPVDRDPPHGRGLVALAKRRHDYNAALAPEMLALREKGLSNRAIADRFNGAGRFNSDGRPWSDRGVWDVIRRHTTAIALGERRSKYNAAIAHEMVALWKGGLSHQEIADRFNEAGRAAGSGRPWTEGHVAQVIRRHAMPEDAAAGRRTAKLRATDRYRLVYPRAAELWREGFNLFEIAARIEADERFKGTGKWTWTRIRHALMRCMEPAEHKALSKRARGRVSKERSQAAMDHDAANVRRIIALREEGKTYEEITIILHEEGRKSNIGKPYNSVRIRHLLVASGGTTKRGKPPQGQPVILGGPDGPARVLGLDRKYLVQPLKSKAHRKVVAALIKAPLEGLSAHLIQNVTGGARGIVRWMLKDPVWGTVTYPPEPENGLGWRFGPPRSIKIH
jgi:transcriptional regulator